MSTRARVRLLGCALAGLLTAGAGCTFHSWSKYRNRSYADWRADDAGRIELLRTVAYGCAEKAHRLGARRGYVALRMSRIWARKARTARLAVDVLERSPAKPRPGCGVVLRKLRWELDYHYPCAVGTFTTLYMHTYLRSTPARRADLRRRIRQMGFYCGPHRSRAYWLQRRLKVARGCATAAPGYRRPSVRTVTPPPAPGQAPSSTPPAPPTAPSTPPPKGKTR